MNSKKHLLTKTGFAGALTLVLAGCTVNYQGTYVPPAEPPPPAVAYTPPAPPPPPPADPTVVVIQSPSDFYEPLSPYGEWVTVAGYGRCWRPYNVDNSWRPYCNGYWQRTDAGWFWVSSEPWAWATYHYGRWDWNVNFGWVWVPQTQWAPSWVAWREGNGYVGWAPLPPTATIAVSGGVVFRDAAYAPHGFVFVQERNLCEPVRPTTVIANNTTVINQTVNITRIQVVNQTVVNDGPRPDAVERAGGRRVQIVAVHDLRQKEETTVIAQHPALRRDNRQNPPAVVSVPPAANTGSEPARHVLPRQTPPAEKVSAPTTDAGPPVVENYPHNNPKSEDTQAKASQPESKPASTAALDPEHPTHKEKAPKAKAETEQPSASRQTASANHSLASSSPEKSHDRGESKSKDKDEKEKNGENPDHR